MLPMVPPSPPGLAVGVGPGVPQNGDATGGGQSPVQRRQQMMLRQRQLALERQKRANKNALGPSVIAQAHDLPMLGPNQVLKAAGWNQLLDLGEPAKPQALNQQLAVTPKKSATASVMSMRSMVTGAATNTDTRLTLSRERGDVHAAPLDIDDNTGHMEELDLSVVPNTLPLDLAQDNIGPMPERKKEMGGWNLEIAEEPTRISPDVIQDEDSKGGRSWFRPWGGGKSKPNNKAATPSRPVQEATSISAFDLDDELEQFTEAVSRPPRTVDSEERGGRNQSSPSASGRTGFAGPTVSPTSSAMHGSRRQVQETTTTIDVMALPGNHVDKDSPTQAQFKGPPRRLEMALPGGIDNDDVEAMEAI